VLNEFWVSSGPLYRALVLSAMGLIAVGLVLTVTGANTQNRALMLTGLPFIGVGLVLHMAGLVVRGRAVRKRLRDR
jgi:hypothetical protein